MTRSEWIALAVVVVAVVVRGWPRRRNDRWHVTFKVERDRSDADKAHSAEDEPPAPQVPPEA